MKTDDLFLTELEPAHHALDTWRRRRKRREPIPETLWDLIVPLARAHGLSPVSRALRLDYYGLQRRVLSERAPDVGPAQEPHFVELKVRPGTTESGCVVELENRFGSKMTLRLAQASRSDALALVEAFWRQRS